MHHRRTSIRATTVSLLAAVAVAAWPVPANGQEPIRVVETVNAATGERHRYVVRDLREEEIRSVQAALRNEGYVGIGWTGRLDDGTQNGLRRFQHERGLVECGCVSYETVVGLGLHPQVVASVAEGGDPRRGTEHATGSSAGIRSEILYPVGIPIYVPRPPACDDDPCDGGDGEDPEDGGESGPEGSGIVIGAPRGATGAGSTGSLAAPPGIRPAPPLPARAPSSGSPR